MNSSENTVFIYNVDMTYNESSCFEWNINLFICEYT